MADQIVLLGINRDSGNVAEVGLFSDMDSARDHIFKCRGGHILWSVWTPRVGDTIKAASITGLSLPPNS